MRTRRFDTLTYARSGSEAEDITLSIASATTTSRSMRRSGSWRSARPLLQRRRPRRLRRPRLRHRRRGDARTGSGSTAARGCASRCARYVLGTLTLRLADSLVVQSIVSYEYGRLFGLRVKNQNTLVVNLPTPLARDSELTLTITYAGRLEPQTPDRETLALDAAGSGRSDDSADADRRRSRAFCTATAATGIRRRRSATTRPRASASSCRRRSTASPAASSSRASRRSLAGEGSGAEPQALRLHARRSRCAISRSSSAASRAPRPRRSRFPTAGAPTARRAMPRRRHVYRSLNLSVEANPRQVQRGRELADRAADIALFYESLIGDSPYSSFTLALVESDLPGGHSPATSRRSTSRCRRRRSSGATIRRRSATFPDFFLAHELAHQWWGQAVGWRNYHEQWLSEGFAQYFAALYAQHQRGDEVFVVGAAAAAQVGHRRVAIRARSTSATASATSAARAASSARWSTTRARRCCTCCGGWSATTRSSAALRRFYRDVAVPQGRHRGFPRGDGDGNRPVARALLRALDLRLDAAAAEGRLPRRRHRRRAARRADRRDLRRAGHGRRCSTPTASRSTSWSPSPIAWSSSASRSPASLRGVDVSKDDGTLAEIDQAINASSRNVNRI